MLNKEVERSVIAGCRKILNEYGVLMGTFDRIQFTEDRMRELFSEVKRRGFSDNLDEIYAEHEGMTFFALVDKVRIFSISEFCKFMDALMEDGEDEGNHNTGTGRI